MNDLKFAFRMLMKNPGFTAVAVITLALGIGATTTVFSVVNGVLLKPLEYDGSDRIVYVYESDPEKGFRRRNTSPANFVDWRRENTVFESLAFTAEYMGQVTRSFLYTGDDGDSAQRHSGRYVPTNYFKTWGVKPMLGRDFTPEEERPGSPRVIVLNHDFWQNNLNGDRNIVGKTITLDNQGRHTYEIVGVLPQYPRVYGGSFFTPAHNMGRPMTRRGGAMLRVVGRLKPGISVARAESELSRIQGGIHDEHHHLNSRGSHMVIGKGVSMVPLKEATVGNVRSSLYVFSGAVFLVLLIACANVANLLLSRALARQREVAVRTALGASRWRIVRQLLCESLLLSIFGGVVGALLGYWGLQLLQTFGAGRIPRMEGVALDPFVLAFTFGVSLVTGLIFGLVPALQTSKSDLNAALKEGTARLTSGLSHNRLSNTFTVAQVALALVLLIGAGLLIQTFNRLQAVESGFHKPDELLTVDVVLNGAVYQNEGIRRNFIRELVERLNGAPGVESACFVSMIPDRGNGWPNEFARMDRPMPQPSKRPRVNTRILSPGFLETYGIPLLRGREFTDADTDRAAKVAVINKAFADKFFPNDNPVGKMIMCGGQREIVGVIGNVKNRGIRNETRAEMYFSYNQWVNPNGFLTIRTKAQDAMALAPVVTEYVRQLNPNQPVKYFRTMKSYLDNATAQPKFRSFLIGIFALVALLLASIGIYGVMAYSVAQRTNEMGIRMALGAQKSDITIMVLRQGLRLTVYGVILGLIGSMAITKVLESYLWGITATDTTTFFSIAGLLAVVGLIACIIPALRAMRTSPNEALRYE
ncbi:MAG: ABC transporter permease [Limisphaerales bacterium]